MAETKLKATNPAEVDSEEEDEDYVPPEKDSEDEGDDGLAAAGVDEAKTGSNLTPSKQRAVDEAFSSLFGGGDSIAGTAGGGPAASGKKGGGKKSKRKAAAGRKAMRKKKKLLAEMFGGAAASKMLSASSAAAAAHSSSGKERAKPLRGLEKRVVTEKKRFAGQEIEIRRTVVGPSGGDTAEVESAPGKGCAAAAVAPKSTSAAPPPRPKAVGGIDAVLADIAGPQKISTVAKTSADWDTFKDRTGLEEELEKKAKGKDAYLVKKDFLQRVDLRTFEKEKEERNRKRAAEGR